MGAHALRPPPLDRPLTRAGIARATAGVVRYVDKALVLLMAFAALSAWAGGSMLVLALGPSVTAPPLSLLRYTPFSSFLVPGLLLAVVVGGTNLVGAYLMLTRSRASIDAALLAGGALSVWIFAEAAMFRSVHGLHIACGALGLAICTLAILKAWSSPNPRHQYVVVVTAAEATGFMAPALVGITTAVAHWQSTWQAVAVSAAGLLEGAVLGLGQGSVLPVGGRRIAFALLTAAGAGLVWTVAMTTRLLIGGETPVWLQVTAGVTLGVVGLSAMGLLQWLELRRHVAGARGWIGWTALAWSVALPFSFAAGPFVDESTPFVSHVVLWGCGGLLMAYVLALVSWQGARRLLHAALSQSPEARRTPHDLPAAQSGNLRPVFLK